MIPTAYIQEWAATTPWPDPRHVEQDLIICRALCDIFAEPYLAEPWHKSEAVIDEFRSTSIPSLLRRAGS